MTDIPDQEAWSAWRPKELAERLAGIDRPWCAVGGWALDLWHGHETREHHDLEFTVLREDVGHFRRALTGTDLPLILLPGPPRRSEGERVRARGKGPSGGNFAFYTVKSGVFEYLPDDVNPDPSISQIWCWDIHAACWRVDIMIESGTPGTWICKRDPAITLPRAEAVRHAPDGIPYLAPAAILLLKAKHLRPKDVADFELALTLLPASERHWLRDSLARLHPRHSWIEML